MKLIKITTSDGTVVAIEHDMSRTERILVAVDDAEHAKLVQRIVDCYNACNDLSDVSVHQLATGTATAGGLAERIVAVSLLYAHNKRLAESFIKKARAEIDRQGGKV